MRKVLKYELGVNGEIVTITGKFVRFLCGQAQVGRPVCWIEVDDDYPEITTQIVAIGTGWDVEPGVMENYLTTIQDGMGYVWHYYMGESAVTED